MVGTIDDFKPEEIEYFERDGEVWGRDDHGEFRVNGGVPEIPQDEDYNYTPCKAVLKYTMERYGEVRYCTGMAESNFKKEIAKGQSDRCKHHKGRDNIMTLNEHNFKTGAFAQSFLKLFGYFEPHKQIICIKFYEDLLNQSIYTFDEEYVTEVVDTSEANWTDHDEIAIDYPVPTENVNRAKYLWVATLEFIKAENIEEQMFEDAYEDPNTEVVGERHQVVAAGENGPVYDRGEHHLNLPLSRIIKDHKDLLKAGGVDTATSDGNEVEVTERTWVMQMDEPDKPEFEEPMPEADPKTDPFRNNVEE